MENELIISSAVSNFLMQENDATLHFEYFSEYTDDIIRKMQTSLILTDKSMVYSDSTIRQYKSAISYFKSFESQLGTRIKIREMNVKLAELFRTYLNEQDLKLNTISQILKKIKAVLGRSVDDNLGFWEGSRIKTPQERSTEIYLSIKEIQKMNNSEMTEAHRRIFDIFCVQLFTGMRYNTVCKFLKNPTTYIKEFEGKSYIEITEDKVNEDICVPLGSAVVDILKRYNGKLTPVSLTRFNVVIKKIGEKSEIDNEIAVRYVKNGVMIEEFQKKFSMLSSHSCRRSFITILKGDKSLTDDEIKTMTGHKNSEQLNHYSRSSKLEMIKDTLGNKFFDTNLSKENKPNNPDIDENGFDWRISAITAF